jgi:hypothetical protein
MGDPFLASKTKACFENRSKSSGQLNVAIQKLSKQASDAAKLAVVAALLASPTDAIDGTVIVSA